MPSPINAPRYHVIQSGEVFVAMCSTDGLNSFRVGQDRAEQEDAIADCVRLARVTSMPAPAGKRVWAQPE